MATTDIRLEIKANFDTFLRRLTVNEAWGLVMGDTPLPDALPRDLATEGVIRWCERHGLLRDEDGDEPISAAQTWHQLHQRVWRSDSGSALDAFFDRARIPLRRRAELLSMEPAEDKRSCGAHGYSAMNYAHTAPRSWWNWRPLVRLTWDKDRWGKPVMRDVDAVLDEIAKQRAAGAEPAIAIQWLEYSKDRDGALRFSDRNVDGVELIWADRWRNRHVPRLRDYLATLVVRARERVIKLPREWWLDTELGVWDAWELRKHKRCEAIYADRRMADVQAMFSRPIPIEVLRDANPWKTNPQIAEWNTVMQHRAMAYLGEIASLVCALVPGAQIANWEARRAGFAPWVGPHGVSLCGARPYWHRYCYAHSEGVAFGTNPYVRLYGHPPAEIWHFDAQRPLAFEDSAWGRFCTDAMLLRQTWGGSRLDPYIVLRHFPGKSAIADRPAYLFATGAWAFMAARRDGKVGVFAEHDTPAAEVQASAEHYAFLMRTMQHVLPTAGGEFRITDTPKPDGAFGVCEVATAGEVVRYVTYDKRKVFTGGDDGRLVLKDESGREIAPGRRFGQIVTALGGKPAGWVPGQFDGGMFTRAE